MSNDNSNTISTKKVDCPTCQKEVIWNEQSSYRPFCSKRCQQIDFGEWASESFSIPVAAGNSDFEGMEFEGLDNENNEFGNLEQDSIKH